MTDLDAKGFDREASARVVADRRGQARAALAASDARLMAMLAHATPPERCGPAMIPSPARGPMIAQAPMGLIPDGSADGWKREHLGYRGRDHARAADAFDLMEAQARRASKGRADAGPLFTAAQVGAGRRYAMLMERHDAAGMRCSSVEAQRGGGTGGGSFIDTVLHEGDLIRAMQQAIGNGVALAVRRVRPSVRGTRAGIRDRVLVDAVCLMGQTISQVLEAHGWALGVPQREAARKSLCEALDRMAMARPYGSMANLGA